MANATDKDTVEKAKRIAALLPKLNCGKCGFDNCGNFAVAVARGEASPFGCRENPSSGYKISEIMGLEVPRGAGMYGGMYGPHQYGIPAGIPAGMRGRLVLYMHRGHCRGHRRFHTIQKSSITVFTFEGTRCTGDT